MDFGKLYPHLSFRDFSQKRGAGLGARGKKYIKINRKF
jgi:hypothetical protein